jgi:hypothetical protein
MSVLKHCFDKASKAMFSLEKVNEITPATVTHYRNRIIFIFCCAAQGNQGKYNSDCRMSLSQAFLP